MSERRPRHDRADAAVDAEEEVAELGRSFAFPPTPDLAANVRARLELERTAGGDNARLRRRAMPSMWERLGRLAGGGRTPARRGALVATLGVLVLAGGVVAAGLGFAGVRIIFVDQLPSPSPGPSATPGATAVGAHLSLGRPVTLPEAIAAVPYEIALPESSELANPDAVYVREPPAGGQVSLLYLPRPGLPESRQTGVGLLYTQFEGRLVPEFARKLLVGANRLDHVTVNGSRGLWIEGPPHGLLYIDRNGREEEEAFRLATNTLLWEQDGLTLRLEGDIDRDHALRIAASIRTAPTPSPPSSGTLRP